MSARVPFVLSTLLVAVCGCGQDRAQSLSAPFGYLQDSAIERFRRSCPTTATVTETPDDGGFILDCPWTETRADTGKVIDKRVSIGTRRQRLILDVSIRADGRADALRLFDRFLADILPEPARDELRRTILVPQTSFHLPAHGGHLANWDEGHGAFDWFFMPYVP